LEFGFGGNGLFSASQCLLFQFLGFPEDASFAKVFVSARKPCDWFFAMVSDQKQNRNEKKKKRMEATPTNSSNDETTTVLWRKKLLKDKDFHYDPFLSSSKGNLEFPLLFSPRL
jgi:hypothetical protein